MGLECKFCNPGDQPSEHLDKLGVDASLDKAKLLDTEHFYVTPDLLPVQPEGKHVLIVPKPTRDGDHYLSYAGLPGKLGYPGEVFNILTRIEQAWDSHVSVFEHGSVNSGSKHQSIYHAHAHVMDTGEIDVIRYMSDVLSGMGIEYSIYDNQDNNSYVHNLRAIGVGGKNYLSVQNRKQILIAYDQNESGLPVDTMPSQITQRNMSVLFTGEIVNWKTIFDINDPSSDLMATLSAQRLVSLVQCLPDCHF